MTTEKKQIKLSELTADVNSGMKKDALCEKYGLNKAQMTGLLRKAGLKIRKFHAPKFELVIDENDQNDAEPVSEVATADNY